MPKKYTVKQKVSNNIVDQLLYNRGIVEDQHKEKFLNPNYDDHMHDSFLLSGVQKVVDRILGAIEKNEKIVVWTDYDADGIPGGALLHDFFKLIEFHNFANYIPDRHLEGYGLNSQGVEEVASGGAKLLITVDCGIRDIEEVEHAKKLGIDVIITDHHEPGEELPEAFAIVNPKLKDSKYPEAILCGSGVVWKLIEALLFTLKKKNKITFGDGQEKWLLDLAGLATLSDMVPLVGENRVISHFGLKVLRKTRRKGLQKLYKILKINSQNLSEDDIGFLITPRINAASRMGHPIDAFNLLVAKTEEEASLYANHLDGINKERKVLVAGIVKEAKKMLKQKWQSSGEKKVITLGNPNWRPAVLGLVANSLSEEYRKPAFLWGRENGNGFKGSCRSDGVTDLVALMESAGDAFENFGGHKMSGGFSLSFDQLENFESALEKAYEKNESRHPDDNILVDAGLSLRDIDIDFANSINQLAPFGVGNEKPVFIFENVIPEKINRFGKNSEHLNIKIRDGSKSLSAISFFASPDQYGDNLKEGIATNLIANVELSYWRGSQPDLRLRIVDFLK